MATSAFIIYTDVHGEIHGTIIHRMGGQAPEQLKERFAGDFDALKEFIDVGSVRGGYRLATDVTPYWDEDEDEQPVDLGYGNSSDYVFHVLPNFSFHPVRLKPTYRIELL